MIDEKIVFHHKLNPYPAKVIFFNFLTLEFVSRHRDSQPHVLENYSFVQFETKYLQILIYSL